MGWVSSTSTALDFRANGSALPMYLLFAVSLVVLVAGVRRLLRELGAAGERVEAPGSGSIARPLRRLVELAVLQRRIVRPGHPRWTHLPIFWGFVVLSLGSLAIMIDIYALRPLGLDPGRGAGFKTFQACLDLFGLLFVGGVGLAIYRRLRDGSARLDDGALPVLGLLLGIGLSGFLLEGLRMRIEGAVEPWAFAGSAVAAFVSAVPGSTDGALLLYRLLWWGHAAAAFGLVAAVPYTALRHLVTSPLNIAVSPRRPSGALATPFNLEELAKSGCFDVKVGASSAADLSWHGRLGLAACAGSGACRKACPAHAAGTPLDPMRLVETLRGGTATPGEEAIWSCTLCGACTDACPVLVDPSRYVVELRRDLVTSGRLGGKRTTLLDNLARARNPYGLSGAARETLAGELGLPTPSDPGQADTVYWLGCAAVFDSRIRKVAEATAGLLERAGVRCAVLGPDEACCGDPARRVGEEGLFQELALANIGVLERHGVKTILTHCAHCFNSLRNEYPVLGGRFEVVHHATLIHDLIRRGKIVPGRTAAGPVTFHDSCYIARFNDGVDPPRAVLGSMPGTVLNEMERSGGRTFCCGAGGANYWYEVPRREPMGAARTKQAAATGAELLVTECPYCLKVLESGPMPVLDIAECVAAALDERKA